MILAILKPSSFLLRALLKNVDLSVSMKRHENRLSLSIFVTDDNPFDWMLIEL